MDVGVDISMKYGVRLHCHVNLGYDYQHIARRCIIHSDDAAILSLLITQQRRKLLPSPALLAFSVPLGSSLLSVFAGLPASRSCRRSMTSVSVGRLGPAALPG